MRSSAISGDGERRPAFGAVPMRYSAEAAPQAVPPGIASILASSNVESVSRIAVEMSLVAIVQSSAWKSTLNGRCAELRGLSLRFLGLLSLAMRVSVSYPKG
jgi:hypothetical protein